MKGPSGRLKFDVRRHWQCLRCQHQERLHARIVHRQCPKCSPAGEAPAWMTLIEEMRPKPRESTPQVLQEERVAEGEPGA